MPDDPKARLAQFVIARRKELRLDQTHLRDRGGPSHATVGQIERGQAPDDMQRGTKAGLELALEWVAGSVDSILAGGVPVPLPSPETVGGADQDGGVLLNLPAEALEGLDAMQRREVIAAAELAALERAREVRRRIDS